MDQQLYGVYTKAPGYDAWRWESTHTTATGARHRRRVLADRRRFVAVYVPERGQHPPAIVPRRSRLYLEPGTLYPEKFRQEATRE